MIFSYHGQNLTLLPERAIWWEQQNALLLADVHLGKDQIFRDHGMAIPQGAVTTDLERISRLIQLTRATRLYVLGDLIHGAPRGTEPWLGQFEQWRDDYAGLEIHVILGNHDRGIRPQLEDWAIATYDSHVDLGPFRLAHDTRGHGEHFCVTGHIHPVLKLQDGRDSLRLPVFWFRQGSAVLPAFGSFTGGHAITPDPSDDVFIVAGSDVLPLNRP